MEGREVSLLNEIPRSESDRRRHRRDMTPPTFYNATIVSAAHPVPSSMSHQCHKYHHQCHVGEEVFFKISFHGQSSLISVLMKIKGGTWCSQCKLDNKRRVSEILGVIFSGWDQHSSTHSCLGPVLGKWQIFHFNFGPIFLFVQLSEIEWMPFGLSTTQLWQGYSWSKIVTQSPGHLQSPVNTVDAVGLDAKYWVDGYSKCRKYSVDVEGWMLLSAAQLSTDCILSSCPLLSTVVHCCPATASFRS